MAPCEVWRTVLPMRAQVDGGAWIRIPAGRTFTVFRYHEGLALITMESFNAMAVQESELFERAARIIEGHESRP